MSAPYPMIPYGWADFRAIRLEHRLYVDKTRFIRPLENERFAFLIRPRRFGKSCWLSLLENYYDRYWAHEFEQIFGGTDIGRSPAENRHSYVALRFDFSVAHDVPETLKREFEDYCHLEIEEALERNADLFPTEATRRVLDHPSASGKLNALFRDARKRGIRLFVLIDEYDNFANTLLAHRGADAYQKLTHGSGFYRNLALPTDRRCRRARSVPHARRRYEPESPGSGGARRRFLWPARRCRMRGWGQNPPRPSRTASRYSASSRS